VGGGVGAALPLCDARRHRVGDRGALLQLDGRQPLAQQPQVGLLHVRVVMAARWCGACDRGG
jgi:hypothetical protein